MFSVLQITEEVYPCITIYTLHGKTPLFSDDLHYGEDTILGAGAITTVRAHTSLITSADSGVGKKNSLVDSEPCQFKSSFMKYLLCVWHIVLLINSRNIFEIVVKFSIIFTHF